MDDLKERVEKFMMLQLPGQPMMMHMGTSYLVQDLWREVKQLRSALSWLEDFEHGLVEDARKKFGITDDVGGAGK